MGCHEVEAEVGNTAERGRPQALGSDAELGPRIIGPAALLLHRLSTAQPLGDFEEEVGDRNVESPGDGDELLGRDVLESTLDLGEIRDRQLRFGRKTGQRSLGLLSAAADDRPQRERRLVLARDRFGIKPLYYRLGEGRISFASELKALLREPDFPREVSREALHSYLAFNSIPAPLTIFESARKLPPGHVLTCSPTGATIERYARPAPAPAGRCRDEAPEILAEELRERLLDSVRAHLLADVPVGVLLSGGIDSSVLTALAARGAGKRTPTVST